MSQRYEHIRFEPVETGPEAKTKIWSCRSNHSDEELGLVRWFGRWHQYCYRPRMRTAYSAGCLADIADFIRQAMRERKINDSDPNNHSQSADH